MINPYKGVDWGKVKHVHSASHMHHDMLVKYMQDDGYEHVAISNYYPSRPILDYETIVDPAWGDSIDTLPQGMVGSPNAEHHNSIVGNRRNSDFHFNGLGSTWESGKGRYEEPVGVYDKTWQTAFNLILAELKVPDGGGITINHPNWYSNEKNKLTQDQIEQFLQYDSRVLGVEIFNAPVEEKLGWAIDVWDNLLKKGIRAWGFCVTDHPNPRPCQGRNVLLVDRDKFAAEANSVETRGVGAECLKAYREGRFYGKIFNTPLQFEEIKFEDNIFTVKTNNATKIIVVVDGVPEEFNSKEISYAVPKGATYVRAQACTDTPYDYVYTNPIMLDPQEDPPVNPPIEPPTPSPDEPELKKISFSKMMWY